MSECVTPEAAYLVAASYGSDACVLDSLRSDQLSSLFRVVAAQESFPTGLSFIAVGCADRSTPDLLVAVVDRCRDWDEFVAASRVLAHPSTNADVVAAVLARFPRHVPLDPTPHNYLSISLILGLLVSTGHVGPTEMVLISEHSSEVAAMTDAVFDAWYGHEASLLTEHLKPGQQLADQRRAMNSSSPELLERIASEPACSLAILAELLDNPCCSPLVLDSVLSRLRVLVLTAEQPCDTALVAALQKTYRSPALTEDHIRRIRRWFDNVDKSWVRDIDQEEEKRRAVQDLVDLPTWLQPEAAHLLSQGRRKTTDEAVSTIAATN